MSLFNDASLIVTPNGYKAGKLYSIVPSSGAGDFGVTRATTATRVNSSGLIESVASNVPRLDYSNGSCPSILVEPQRTNLLLNSATVATQTINVTAVAHTISFYGSGTITLSGVHSATVVGTGTTRKTYTFTPTAGTLTLTVSGTCTNGQLEAGAYPTSYIPTTSASVTRNADVISKTGISSLINSEEGTLFFEFTGTTTQTNVYYSLSAGGLTNTIIVGINPIGQINARIFAPFPTIAINVGGFVYSAGQRYKVAFAYNSTQCAIAVNGVIQTTSGFVGFSPNTLSRIGIDNGNNGNAILLGNHKEVLLFKTRLSNAELQQLTTL
jgi:hypothetical protein